MRIERVIRGVVRGTPKLHANGKYKCLVFGKNVEPVEVSTLEEVAEFLRANPRGGVRMEPGDGKVSKNIFIDGKPR